MEVGAALAVLSILCVAQLAGIAVADATTPPALSDAIPRNNTYVHGGNRDFYVGVKASDLNTSEVMLYIKSVEAQEWDRYAMACTAINAADWNCTTVISFNIVGSDTTETYYFEANDTSSNMGSLGDRLHPLMFTVDINRPVFEFVNPLNNTWVAAVEAVTFKVTDASSGVDSASVAYSTDNSSWIAMTTTDNLNYNASWSTLALANNQPVVLYAKASDNIGNTGYAWLNVTVDNENPASYVLRPSAGETLSGVAKFEINASDAYSGIKISAVRMSVGGVGGYQRLMTCAAITGGYKCDGYFDTTILSDGTHTVNFSVSDNAGNSVSPSVQVTTYNKETYVSISGPSSGSYIRGVVTVNASVANPTSQVSSVQLKVTGPAGSGYSDTKTMSCSSTFTLCQLAVDTTQLSDGQYTLFANVINTAGKTITSSVSVTVDNTLPLMAIDSPASTVVSGTIYPKVVVTDNGGVAAGSVSFSMSSYSYIMTCSIYVTGKKYVCGWNFDTRVVSDNYYLLTFYASDIAGNTNTASMTLLVDNVESVGPSPNETTTTITTAPAGAGTTTITTAPAGAGTTTTTQQAGQPTTMTTSPPSVWQDWVENSDSPVAVLVWNAQTAFDTTFNTWPLKAFAISMIVFLIILAVFRTSQARRLFEKKKETIELG
jgi:hypothetical protein